MSERQGDARKSLRVFVVSYNYKCRLKIKNIE